jgi:hypothetical protein
MKPSNVPLIIVLLLISILFIQSISTKENKDIVQAFTIQSAPTVTINISPFSTIYEGDIIPCNITGNLTDIYWQINNHKPHRIFHENNPMIFNPEPTPLDHTFINLTIHAENSYGTGSDTIQIKLNKIFFGDIHWHTLFSDGQFDIDTMYQQAIEDNYLDFTACTDHAELLDGINTCYRLVPRFGGIQQYDTLKTILNKILGYSEWQTMKEKAIEYYDPGKFTTLLGFEWTAAEWSPGGHKLSPNGWGDVGHINFYYKDIYPEAREYSDLQKMNYDSIFQAMHDEYEKGHLNIGFPHHPQGKASWLSFTTNWSYLTNRMSHIEERYQILRGVETYSRWGTSIGQYYTPKLPWTWAYNETQFYNQTDAWIENALWEWSQNTLHEQQFGFIASSDTHDYNRPGSALYNRSHLVGPSGLVAVYAVHNTREEIWNALNNCSSYALQLLKNRVNVRVNGLMAYGRWINCSSPLEIQITACATSPGFDRSGKSMCPHGLDSESLEYVISDIWLVKKDRDRGRPWCKVIKHVSPKTPIAIETFVDTDIQSNDFYWIAIKQQSELGSSKNNEFMTFLGPIFIQNIINQ